MKKTIYFLAAFVLLLTSCKKEQVEKQELPDLPSSSFLARSFSYPEQGIVSGVRHGNPYTITNVSLNATQLVFHSRSTAVSRGAEDDVVFILNKAKLNAGYIGEYTLGTFNAPVVAYTYHYKEDNGSQWSTIIDSRTGVQYQGSFKIERYDAERNLISGSYEVTVNNLVNDPVKNTTIIDPRDKCNVTINGAFVDMKIKMVQGY